MSRPESNHRAHVGGENATKPVDLGTTAKLTCFLYDNWEAVVEMNEDEINAALRSLGHNPEAVEQSVRSMVGDALCDQLSDREQVNGQSGLTAVDVKTEANACQSYDLLQSRGSSRVVSANRSVDPKGLAITSAHENCAALVEQHKPTFFFHGYALGIGSTILGRDFTKAVCTLPMGGRKASASKSATSQPPGITIESTNAHENCAALVEQHKPSFFFHGHGLGIGSTIPGRDFTKAVCTLPIGGGKASASKSAISQPPGITIESANSSVSGAELTRDGLYVWVTKASVAVLKLNILGKLTADKVEAHIFSEFHAGDYEASTVIAGSKFDNVRIDGKPLQIRKSQDLSEFYPTYASMQTAFQNKCSRKKVLACLVGRDIKEEEASSPDLLAAYETYCEQDKFPSLKPVVVCSCVTKVRGGDFKTWGPIVAVPNFGNIYLGEVIVWPWMRCLNMFRVELRSGATVSVGSLGVGTRVSQDEPLPPTNWEGLLLRDL